MTECRECNELGRRAVVSARDRDSLATRMRNRHASRPERRRLLRLKTDADIAMQMLQIHRSSCKN